MIAAPALLLGRARAQMPIMMQQGSSGPLLNTLAAGTTVVGAWSTGRLLKTGAAGAFYSNTIGSASNLIPFLGTGIVDTSTLTTANMGLYGGPGGNTSQSWVDQSGNGNSLGRGNTNSRYCPVTTGAGALNAPITIAGGSSVPMLSLGYNGLSVANNGPFISTNPLGTMPVDYGTSAACWAFMMVRLASGVGDVFGSLANFVHTGDIGPSAGAGSAEMMARDNSTTSGLMYAEKTPTFATDTAPVGRSTCLGSVFDGTNITLYVDGVAGTPVAYSGALAAGGNFASGDWANAGAFGTHSIGADIAELITGTAIAAADIAGIPASMRAFFTGS